MIDYSLLLAIEEDNTIVVEKTIPSIGILRNQTYKQIPTRKSDKNFVEPIQNSNRDK